jgi:hypothetical protein
MVVVVVVVVVYRHHSTRDFVIATAYLNHIFDVAVVAVVVVETLLHLGQP